MYIGWRRERGSASLLAAARESFTFVKLYIIIINYYINYNIDRNIELCNARRRRTARVRHSAGSLGSIQSWRNLQYYLIISQLHSSYLYYVFYEPKEPQFF